MIFLFAKKAGYLKSNNQPIGGVEGRGAPTLLPFYFSVY
jgi:hypothetical protein